MAIKKTFEIALDIKREDASPAFHLIEGDNGNVFKITLTDDNVAVSLSGCLVNVVFSSKNGVCLQTSDPGVANNGVSIGGTGNNVITVDVFPASYGVGLNIVEVQVYSKSSGSATYDVLVTTARFAFEGVRSLMNEDSIRTTAEYPLLVKLINDVEGMLAIVTPYTHAYADAVRGNAAGITVEVNQNDTYWHFTIPDGIHVGNTQPTGDEEIWVIPDDDGVVDGVMNTATYDQNGNGIVDNAEKLNGQSPSYYATATSVTNEATARANADATEVTNRNSAIAAAIAVETAKKGAANGYATLNGDTKVTAAQASAKIVTSTSSRTLQLSDAGCLIMMNSSSSLTVTIPLNSAVAFPTGTEIEICKYGTGSLNIAGASGVTIVSAMNAKRIPDQYGVACLKKLDTNTWLLAGSIEV